MLSIGNSQTKRLLVGEEANRIPGNILPDNVSWSAMTVYEMIILPYLSHAFSTVYRSMRGL